MTDTFNGDNALLVSCIEAILKLDARGAIVPHGIGGHARELLSAAASRLDALPAIKEAEAVTDEMVERAWNAYWADEFFGLPQDHSKRMRAALSTAIPAGDGVPPGMVLVPEKFRIDATAIANLVFQCGANEDNTEFFDAVAWIGELDGEGDEPAIYGVHAYSTEYPEDGSVTLAHLSTTSTAGKG